MVDDFKTGSYKETNLQSKIEKPFNNQIQQQTALPKTAPALQFQRAYKTKKNSAEQKAIEVFWIVIKETIKECQYRKH